MPRSALGFTRALLEACYVDLVEPNLPSALLVAIEVLVVVCVFGWLPMLIAGIVSLRRQTRESAPNQGEA